ncbi:unnamed protein product [Prorocentrum cordatum]|uniref:Uncharacterized protein n=1 Tax=Prorocentrum cordatum TaxID=2364126 RepID=A0ABN9RKJ7_9DINO|nr:unnamed protein product [Polarella glacialis]
MAPLGFASFATQRTSAARLRGAPAQMSWKVTSAAVAASGGSQRGFAPAGLGGDAAPPAAKGQGAMGKGAPQNFNRVTRGARAPGKVDVDLVDAVISLQNLGLRTEPKVSRVRALAGRVLPGPEIEHGGTEGRAGRPGLHRGCGDQGGEGLVFSYESGPKFVKEISSMIKGKEAHSEDGAEDKDIQATRTSTSTRCQTWRC